MHATTPERSHSAVRPAPAPARPRALLRAALLAGGLTFAALLLLPQLHEVPAALDTFVAADPKWMAIAAACALSAYGAGALALQASTTTRLPLGRNLQVQLASAAAGALTPAGAGGLALHVHFLERNGLPRPQAIAAVSLGRLTAAGVHLITLLLLLPGLANRIGTIEIPATLPIALLISAAVGFVLVQRFNTRARLRSHRLLTPLRVALRSVLTDPRRIVGLLGGSLLFSACRAITFAAALRSLGVEVPIFAVVALFLAAEALGALSSAPGGLGVLDGVLLTGVISLGAAPASGLGAVLLFRLLTLWGPLLPGLLAARLLRPRPQRHASLPPGIGAGPGPVSPAHPKAARRPACNGAASAGWTVHVSLPHPPFTSPSAAAPSSWSRQGARRRSPHAVDRHPCAGGPQREPTSALPQHALRPSHSEATAMHPQYHLDLHRDRARSLQRHAHQGRLLADAARQPCNEPRLHHWRQVLGMRVVRAGLRLEGGSELPLHQLRRLPQPDLAADATHLRSAPMPPRPIT